MRKLTSRRPAAWLVILALLVTFSVTLVGSAPAAQSSGPGESLVRPTGIAKNSRLDSRLAEVAAAGPTQALPTATRNGLDTANNRVRVVVETSGAGAQAAVAAAGGTVESAAGGLIEALVPAAGLDGLSRSTGVARVRAPLHAVALGVESQGVSATSASAWHAAGANGTGAKVAVIDLGFQGYTARQAAGELPAGLVTQDYCGGSMGAPEPHGTAVAEIVHEMAPGAQLYLICIDTEVDLRTAKDYAKANSITIVNHSVGWFNSGRGDGSGGPSTPDGIVADARGSGILWVNAAGNSAQQHWSGTFSDTDGDGSHNFGGPDNGNTIFLANGQKVCGFLKWDAWPTTNQDFDLFLVRSSPPPPPASPVVAYSINDQSGSPQAPREALCYTNTLPAQNFYFAIPRFSASTAPRFDLFVPTGNTLEYRNADGSVVEPASSPNAFAAGAICWNGDGLEPYSSLGPTIDGRVKPDIGGQAAVTSAIYGSFTSCASSGFTGTSAAAPHAAGAAALWKGAIPLASSDAIRSMIQADALDLGPGGFDSSFGAGMLRLPTAAPDAVTQERLPTTTTSISVGGTINSHGIPTVYYWEYGLSTAYGSQTGSLNALNDRVSQSYGSFIAGLDPATTYHFRLVATNMFGTSRGGDIAAETLGPPAVTAGAAPTLGATKASVSGTVDPNGSATTYRVEYGADATYGQQTGDASAGAGSSGVLVNATLTGLDPITEYHYRFVATNAQGTTNGPDLTFTTAEPAVAPVVTTGAASAITVSSALIAGTVNPGREETTYQVEYGMTVAYGSMAPVPAASAGFGATDVAVAVPLSGLSSSTTYHYRLIASSSVGPAAPGADATFTTAAPPPPPPPPPGGGGGGGGGSGSADLGLEGYAQPVAAAVNEEVTFYLRVSDVNFGIALGVNVDVTLPAGLQLVSSYADRGPGCGGGPLVCNLDWMSSDAPYASITIKTKVIAAGEQTFKAAVRYGAADAKPENNEVTIVVNKAVTPPFTPPVPPRTTLPPTTKTGTARADTLRGTSRPDTLRGLGGNDSLYGLAGNDRLYGGSGNDRLFGGTGRDLIDGGPGNDTISARDKTRDTIRCGPGRDTVTADRTDTVARDCERVSRR